MTPRVRLVEIKKSIGFNLSEMAAIFGTTVSEINGWLESPGEFDAEKSRRLDQIYDICTKWKQTGLGRMDMFARREVYGSQTIRDLFAAEVLDMNAIGIAMGKLESMMIKHNEAKMRHKAFIKKHGLEDEARERQRLFLDSHRCV